MVLTQLVSLLRAELITAKILSNIIYFLKNQLRQCIFQTNRFLLGLWGDGGWREGILVGVWGRRRIPKLIQGAHFIYSGVGSHTMGGGQFIYLIMRGACYRQVGNLNLCWMRGGITQAVVQHIYSKQAGKSACTFQIQRAKQFLNFNVTL